MAEEKTLANKVEMLAEALKEIDVFSLHDDIDNPVSLSMELYNLGIHDPEVKTKLIRKTVEIIDAAKDIKKLTLTDFVKEYKQINSFLDSKSEAAYILNWIGKYQVPDVYPIAQALSLTREYKED